MPDDVTCVGNGATRDGVLDAVPSGTYEVASFVVGYTVFVCLRYLFQLGGIITVYPLVTQASLRPSRIDTSCTTQPTSRPRTLSHPPHHAGPSLSQ